MLYCSAHHGNSSFVGWRDLVFNSTNASDFAAPFASWAVASCYLPLAWNLDSSLHPKMDLHFFAPGLTPPDCLKPFIWHWQHFNEYLETLTNGKIRTPSHGWPSTFNFSPVVFQKKPQTNKVTGKDPCCHRGPMALLCNALYMAQPRFFIETVKAKWIDLPLFGLISRVVVVVAFWTHVEKPRSHSMTHS